MTFALFLVTFLSCQVVASAVKGWTYRTTDNTCDGTNANPCGPDYWYKAAGASTCAAASQSPIDISNVEISDDFSGPVPKPLNGGCDVSVQYYKSILNLMILFCIDLGPILY